MRVFGAAALLVASFAATAAAQTTVVLNSPSAGVVDTYIRAGSYARRIYNNGVLVTKASSNADYVRRALLKFDTQNYVPANATIQSATLTLTLRRSDASSRTLSAYRVASSFDEWATTWMQRRTGLSWSTPGGDLGSRYATATVGTTAGTQVAFDLTTLVQQTVRGTYGSRYTRVAIVDAGAASSTSGKQFYSSEASDPSVRPRLRIVYGSTTSTGGSTGGSTTTSTLKVLHWNIHYGIGRDGSYGLDKYVDHIVRINPDVVSLNEVEKFVSGHGNENQPALFASKLTSRTGRTWYYHFAERFNATTSNGSGNLILSRFPILSRAQLAMSYNRSAALVTVNVNGRNINVVSTHLASESYSYRSTQIRQLMSWARGFSDQLIIAGDFNDGLSDVPYIRSEYADGWTTALAAGTEQDYPGNYRYGSTFINSYKIDFIFKALSATRLRVRSARMFDTRNSSGVMPSDHKPLMVTLTVN